MLMTISESPAKSEDLNQHEVQQLIIRNTTNNIEEIPISDQFDQSDVRMSDFNGRQSTNFNGRISSSNMTSLRQSGKPIKKPKRKSYALNE